jgi:DNA-binding IclR family transcriptional regulator
MTSGDEGFVPVKSADRVMAILELLSTRHRRLSLSEISQELGIPVSSLHGILRTMQRRMWLEVDETNTRFGIGVQALLVGANYPRGDDLVERAAPVLDWLSEQTGETVHYGRLDGAYVVYLAKRECRYQLRIHTAVGRRIPAHAASLGKAILACCPDDYVRDLFSWPLEKLTKHTLTTQREFFADLQRTRRLGYAAEIEESDEGLACVAVTVPGHQPLHDAMSITAPTVRLGAKRVKELAKLLLQGQAMLTGRSSLPASPRTDDFLRNLD